MPIEVQYGNYLFRNPPSLALDEYYKGLEWSSVMEVESWASWRHFLNYDPSIHGKRKHLATAQRHHKGSSENRGKKRDADVDANATRKHE